MDDGKPIFTTASDSHATTTVQDSFTSSENSNGGNGQESGFSPLAAPFQSRMDNELLSLMTQQEPRPADTAPSAAELDDVLMNLHINSSDLLFDDIEPNSHNNYYMGSRTDPASASHSNIWSEGSGQGGRNGEMIDTFDFLVKSLSSANNYVSMLTREQLSVLRSIRPSLLYEFLQEVAKVRSDKRMRRALPNECAFCKNNGENEENYSSHALKDWRGRVLCPVLRAFRCPRCGATGDRAHTIKYCPENADTGVERSGLLARRRMQAGSLMLGTRACAAPATPTPSPSVTSNINHSMWSSFGMN
ncbi:unnamed protein product, partial [Brenthis ino]